MTVTHRHVEEQPPGPDQISAGLSRDVLTVVAAAVASMLLSPVIVAYAIVLGTPVAVAGWVLARRTGRGWARRCWLVAAGVVLGAIPYLLLAVAVALVDGTAGAGHGAG